MGVAQQVQTDWIGEALGLSGGGAEKGQGYRVRGLFRAAMPFDRWAGRAKYRSCGRFSMSMSGPAAAGAPSGAVGRLVLEWLSLGAAEAKGREVAFTAQDVAQLVDVAGEWSDGEVRRQMVALFGAKVRAAYDDDREFAVEVVQVAEGWRWDHKAGRGVVVLSEAFATEARRWALAVDRGALRALRASPLALDIYSWLRFRVTYGEGPRRVPWEALRVLFGSEQRRQADFEQVFSLEAAAVASVFGGARVVPYGDGVEIRGRCVRALLGRAQ